ncbi:hypothetical protein B0H14DRAFT_2598183 [Mycena olivaceomarginata]|nr:hypothetical protein B0H14DRAFT_2598183 [Mycena olivaceomarginata]
MFKLSSSVFSALVLSAIVAFGDGCSQTYTVMSGDTCSTIESRFGISDAQLHTLNPGINSGCTNLSIGQILCLGGCRKTYKVKPGDTCTTIEAQTRLTHAQLLALNPGLDCSNLLPGQVLCLSL